MNLTFEEKVPINYYEIVAKNEINPDVEIVVRNKVIKAHKQVLGTQNPIFLDKFLSQPDLARIEILDLDPTAVEVFIHYLYTGKISDDSLNDDLFRVAHRYVDPNLKNLCRGWLGKNLTTQNVVKRLLTFQDLGEENWTKETVNFLIQNFNDVKTQPGFMDVFKQRAIFDIFDSCKVTILFEKKSYQTKKSTIDAAMKSDMTIKVQDHMFLAHKNVLASRNSVFETTIEALASKYISIPDSDPETFKVFLKHIYNHKVEKKDITAELFEVAHKYMDSKLQKICEDHFALSISEKNAVQLLLLSTNVENKQLEELSLKFITSRFETLNLREEFVKNKNNPSSVEAIFKVFELVMENSKNEKDVQSVLLKNVTDSFNIQKNTETYLGTITLEIPKQSPSKTRSKSFYLKQIPWYLRGSMTAENQGHVGLYLCCDDMSIPYSHKITYSLKMLSSTDKKFEQAMNATSVFASTDASQTTNSWGLKNFIALSDLNDATKGFLQDGSITVRVEAKVVE